MYNIYRVWTLCSSNNIWKIILYFLRHYRDSSDPVRDSWYWADYRHPHDNNLGEIQTIHWDKEIKQEEEETGKQVRQGFQCSTSEACLPVLRVKIKRISRGRRRRRRRRIRWMLACWTIWGPQAEPSSYSFYFSVSEPTSSATTRISPSSMHFIFVLSPWLQLASETLYPVSH